MAYLILSSKRTRQPRIFVRANPKWNPSALWLMTAGVDVVSKKLITTSAYSSFTTNSSGVNLKVTGDAIDRVILNVGDWVKPEANNFSIVAVWTRTDYDRLSVVSKWNTGADPATSDWYLGADNGFTVACGASTYSTTGGYAATNGVEFVSVGVRDGTTIWSDRYLLGQAAGRQTTTNAGITTINNNAARKIKLGEIDYGGGGYSNYIQSPLLALFPYALCVEQAQELAFNPWQLFAPDPRRLWFAPSGGGATIITSSGAASLVAKANAAVAATKTTTTVARSAVAGAATATSIRVGAAAAKATSAGTASTTTIRTATIAANTASAGASAATTLRTGLAAGRLTRSAETTYAAIISGTFTAAGRTPARGTAAYTSTHAAAAAATAATRGTAASTTLRTGIAAARVDARAAVTAAALVAGTVTTSAAAQISARASVGNTTERVAAVAAMLALRGATPAAPELPVIVPPSTRTLSPDHARFGLSPVAPAKPRLG